jgi:Protein of unknown function (DUF3352)
LQMLDGLGSPDELVGWIDDAGIAVSVHDDVPDAAVLLAATDEAAATLRVTSLKTLLTVFGLGDGVEVSESTVNGVAVTTVTIADVGSLVPSGSVPGVGDIPTSGPISFSLAAQGKVLIVAVGEGAMAAILNTSAGSSLADNAAFKHAIGRGLSDARATVYLGVGATIALAEGFMSADELATYQSDAAPYLEPLEAMLFQAASDEAGQRSRMVITVNP